ncbi:MAG: glycosyltransferase family 4 protein [Desulfarculales bacterium]|nr:glycosyltransferase family 4 protein [Desulfarculales bacterium]
MLKKEHPSLPVLEKREEREFLHTPQSDEYLAITPYIGGLLRSREYLRHIDIHVPEGRLTLWQYACTETDLLEIDPAFYKRCRQINVYDENIDFPIPLLIYIAVQKKMYIFSVLKTLPDTCFWLIENEDKIDCGIDRNVILHHASMSLQEPGATFHDGNAIPLYQGIFLSQRPDLSENLRTSQELDEWIHTHGRKEYESLDKFFYLLERMKEWIAHRYTETPCAQDIPRLTDGVNVIGYGFSELGIGEDARCAMANCDAAGISAALYNLPLKIISSSSNRTYTSRVDGSLPHTISLYCLPMPEFARALFAMPSSLRKGRYQIVAPPWELPHYPQELALLLDFAEEFWAPSRFVAQTLKEVTDKPVLHMPLSVILVSASGKRRLDFGLPNDAFLFLFVFDWLSWPQRKNPEAAINAFLRAFSRQDNVVLVIKTMNAKKNKDKLYEILPERDIGKRFYIIDEILSSADMSALYGCCDAYVSLHRSEGFGRTIAEAMLAKLPVITTNYSGNTDFCFESTAFLVNGPHKPLREGDYLFWKNQRWCEPSIEEAAVQMKLCASNRALAQDKAQKAFAYITTHHSPRIVGEYYENRLRELKQAGIA